MGSWGPGIYSNDTASELRDWFKTIKRLPLSGDELFEIISDQYPLEDDDMASTVWIVVADQFHRFGIDCETVTERSRSIIRSGADDESMKLLDMSQADRKKRGVELLAALDKWATPHPKPGNRNMLKAPDKHAVSPGDIWIFPTEDGNPANTNNPLKYNLSHFKPDGWAAFAVARNEHRYGYFSVSYFLRLFVESKDRPAYDDCRDAPICGRILKSWGETEPRPAVGWAALPATILKNLQAEKIGQVPVSWSAVTDQLPLTDFDPRNDPPSIYSGLHVSNKTLPDPGEWDCPAPLQISLPDICT